MKIKSLFLLCFTLIVSTQLYGSAGQAALAAQTACAEPAAAQKPWAFPIYKANKGVGGQMAVAFSPHGTHLAVGDALNKTITIFEVDKTTGVLKYRSRIEKIEAWYIQYSPDGKWLAVSTQRTMYLFTVEQSSGDLTFSHPTDLRSTFKSFAFSPDSRFLAVATFGAFKTPSEIILFALCSPPMFKRIPFKEHLRGLDYSHDGTWISAIDGATIYIFNAQTLIESDINKSIAMTRPIDTFNKCGVRIPLYIKYLSSENILILGSVGQPIYGLTVDINNKSMKEAFKTTFDSSDNVACSFDDKWIISYNRQLSLSGISISMFDHNQKTLKTIEGSPFDSNETFIGFAYSPDNRLLAAAHHRDGSVWIYEVDQETGAVSRITGDLLKVVKQEKEYQEAYKALVESEPPVLNPDVASIMKEYVVGPQPKKMRPLQTQEASDISALQKEKTDKERASAALDANKLFKAIKDDNQEKVVEHLTPFTINATNDAHETPLLAAVRKPEVSISIVQKILNYTGQRIYAHGNPESSTVKLDAVDTVGNTALILALLNHKRNHALAMAIAQKMTPTQRAPASKKGTTALALAEKYEKRTDSKPEKEKYQKLIALLKQK